MNAIFQLLHSLKRGQAESEKADGDVDFLYLFNNSFSFVKAMKE